MKFFIFILKLFLYESYLMRNSKLAKRSNILSVYNSKYKQYNDNSPQNLKENLSNNLNRGITVLSKMAVLSITSSVMVVPFSSIVKAEGVGSEFQLPPLSYKYDALEPYISKNTLFYHHDKHHAKYISTTNTMVKGTEYENISDLTSLMIKSHQDPNNKGLFNNAAQSWNHDFYWKCMSPNDSGKDRAPTGFNTLYKKYYSGKLLTAIDESFGSYDEFKKAFKTAGLTTFGSGWTWLVKNIKTGKLEIMKTIGAENPLVMGDGQNRFIPILTMDVWEHAYYLDYQNERDKYEENFINKLINWQFVENQLKNIK